MNYQEIEINNKRINIFDYDQRKYTSIHTGAELMLISFRCNITGEKENKWFLEVLNSNEIIIKLLPLDDKAKYFVSKEKSYSYTSRYDGQPTVYSHTVSLKEKEKIDIRRINVDDLVLEPYEYSEDEHDETRLAIKFKCIIDEEKRNKLIALHYSKVHKFGVIRDGIDKQPRIMRFGRLTWSKIKDKQEYKYEVNLVDYSDKEENNPFADPLVVANLSDYLTSNRMVLHKLIEKLIESNVITKENIKLNLEDEKDWTIFSKMHHDLFNVEDVDKDNN